MLDEYVAHVVLPHFRTGEPITQTRAVYRLVNSLPMCILAAAPLLNDPGHRQSPPVGRLHVPEGYPKGVVSYEAYETTAQVDGNFRASSSMAEQRTLNPQVLGSNPRGRTSDGP